MGARPRHAPIVAPVPSSVRTREHQPVPRVRRAPRRTADLRPPGRPGRQGARPRRGHPLRGKPAAGAGHGGRGVRAPAHLRADDPGDQHRQRAGLHDRAAEHAALRAATHRDARRRPALRQDGHGQGQRGDRHDLRRRDGAGSHARLGAQPGRDPGARQGAAPPRTDPRGRVGRGRGPDPARAHPGRHAADPRAQRAASRRRGQRHPRPPLRATYRRRRGPLRRAAGRCPRGAARGGPGRDHGPARAASERPTCSRRWIPTTPPT